MSTPCRTHQGYSRIVGRALGGRPSSPSTSSSPTSPYFDVDDVILGNGVSELITMTTQALLNDGDEVLIPAPDYPLWTAMTSLAGGTPVHCKCDEGNDWNPDIADIASKITDRTGDSRDQPQQPDGCGVFTGDPATARRPGTFKHSLLIRNTDEIYDKILRRRRAHQHRLAGPDLLCLTFNGLSKAYRVCVDTRRAG